MSRLLTASFGFLISLSFASVSNAEAVAANACSDRVVSSLAKALAARETAGQTKDTAKSYLDLEKENQARLAAGLEVAHARAIDVPNSYVAAVKPTMVAAINKAYEKEKSSLSKKAASAISARQRAYDKAVSALEKAKTKVPTVSCTY